MDPFPNWRTESLQTIKGREFLLQWWLETLTSPSYVATVSRTQNASYATETAHLKKVMKNLLSDLSSVRNDLEHGCRRRDKFLIPGFTKAELASLGHTYQDYVEQLDHASGYHIWQAMSLNAKVTADARPKPSASDLQRRWYWLQAELDALRELSKPRYIYGRSVHLDQFERRRRAQTLYEQLEQLGKDFSINTLAIEEYARVRGPMSQISEDLRNILEQTQDASIRNKDRAYRERSWRGGGRSPEYQDRDSALSASISEQHDRLRKRQRKSVPRAGKAEPRVEEERCRDYDYDLRRRHGDRDGDWTDTRDSYHGGLSRSIKARW